MNFPVEKNKRWVAGLHESIARLDEGLKASIMESAGEKCASDLLTLCAGYLGKEIVSVEDLVNGWNNLRRDRNLTGRWQSEGDTVVAVFRECGCSLVRSGMIELHPNQCYCSQGMMNTIFSTVAGRRIRVELTRAIGRGDEVCEFRVRL